MALPKKGDQFIISGADWQVESATSTLIRLYKFGDPHDTNTDDQWDVTPQEWAEMEKKGEIERRN
jgi:hypothetical protein